MCSRAEFFAQLARCHTWATSHALERLTAIRAIGTNEDHHGWGAERAVFVVLCDVAQGDKEFGVAPYHAVIAPRG